MQIRITKSVLLLLTMFQATKAFVGPIVRRRAGAALVSRGAIHTSIAKNQNVRVTDATKQLSQSSFRLSSAAIQNIATKLHMSTSAEAQVGVESLAGIEWIKEGVAKVLNDSFDPKEVARAAALAKLEPKKKKKKKKKQAEDTPPAEEKPEMSQEEKDAIGQVAADAAKPFGFSDAMVTPATKLEFGDYQCNAAMGLAKNVGMSPRDCAMKIVDGIRPLIEDIMEEPEIAGPGFINLRFKKEYLEKSVQNMAKDAERLAVPVTR